MAIVIDRSNPLLRAGAAGINAYQQAAEAKQRREAYKASIEIARQRAAALKQSRERDQVEAQQADEDRMRRITQEDEERPLRLRALRRADQAGEIDLNVRSLRAEREASQAGDQGSLVKGRANRLRAYVESEYPNVPDEVRKHFDNQMSILEQMPNAQDAALFADDIQATFDRKMLPTEHQRLAAEIDHALRQGDVGDDSEADEKLARIRDAHRAGKGDPKKDRESFNKLMDEFSVDMSKAARKQRVSKEILSMVGEPDAMGAVLDEPTKAELEFIAARVQTGRMDPEAALDRAQELKFGRALGDRQSRAFEKLHEQAVKRYGPALKDGLISIDEYDRRIDSFVQSHMPKVPARQRTSQGGAAGADGGGAAPQSFRSVSDIRDEDPDFYNDVIKRATAIRTGPGDAAAKRKAAMQLAEETGVDLGALDEQAQQDIQNGAFDSWMPKSREGEVDIKQFPPPKAPQRNPFQRVEQDQAKKGRFFTQPSYKTIDNVQHHTGGDTPEDAHDTLSELVQTARARVQAYEAKVATGRTSSAGASTDVARQNLEREASKRASGAREAADSAITELKAAAQEYIDLFGELPSDIASALEELSSQE